jgi:hypothetical protein
MKPKNKKATLTGHGGMGVITSKTEFIENKLNNNSNYLHPDCVSPNVSAYADGHFLSTDEFVVTCRSCKKEETHKLQKP